MGNTWIINMRHYLREDGSLGPLNGPTKRLADYFGSIVIFASNFEDDRFLDSDIPCRRRPGRKRCQGKIQAVLDLDTDNIVWQCPVCGDNGVISGWQDTRWDFSEINI